VVLKHRGGASAHREVGAAIGGKNFQVGGFVGCKPTSQARTPSPPVCILVLGFRLRPGVRGCFASELRPLLMLGPAADSLCNSI